MTNIELGALAHRAGFGEKTENSIRIEEFAKLKKFAALVEAAARADEREACAQAAERIKRFYTVSSFNDQKARCANEIKTSILKRGEA